LLLRTKPKRLRCFAASKRLPNSATAGGSCSVAGPAAPPFATVLVVVVVVVVVALRPLAGRLGGVAPPPPVGAEPPGPVDLCFSERFETGASELGSAPGAAVSAMLKRA
jgi:hypothetical protein